MVFRCRGAESRGTPDCLLAGAPARLVRRHQELLLSDSDATDSNLGFPWCSNRSHSPSTPSPVQDRPRSWSYPIARFDSALRLPHVPTPSFFVLASGENAPATHVHASLAAPVCDSPQDFPFGAATWPPGDSRTRVFLRRPPRFVRRIAGPLGSSAAASGNTNSTG